MTDLNQSPEMQTKREAERCEEILAKMSIEEKVGQLFVVRCPQTDVETAIATYKLGGLTLYAVDFEHRTPDSLRAAVRSWNRAATLPLLIAADEEGGRVVRASKYPQFRAEPFQNPQSLYAAGGLEAVRADTREKAAFLKDLGINFNYAPVCDMATSPHNFIYDRTLGLPAPETAAYAKTVVETMNACGLIGSVKHFPGYGDNVDTHTSIAHDSRSLETFMQNDLLPFIEAIRAGAPIVMVAHNIVECLDPDTPASLSPAVHRFLREQLHFDGIIMTDSLDMAAITLYTGDRASAVQAVLAGNDLLCCSSYERQVPAVLEAVADGTIEPERIDASVRKLLMLKLRMRILRAEQTEQTV